MPLQDYISIISVDDYLIKYWRVWADRLPAKYQDTGPHVVEDDKVEYWIYEGQRVPALGGMETTVRSGRDGSREGYSPCATQHSAEVAAGCFNPIARLEDMDIDGVEEGSEQL